MKFEDIPFVRRTNRHGVTLGIYVNDGRNFIPKYRLVQMRNRVLMKIDELDWPSPQPTKAFYDIDDWKRFKVGKAQTLGRALRFLADHVLLSLRCTNPEVTGPKLYERLSPTVGELEDEAATTPGAPPIPRPLLPKFNGEAPICP